MHYPEGKILDIEIYAIVLRASGAWSTLSLPAFI